MRRLQTGSHAGAWGTASIQDVTAVVVLGVVEESLETRLDKAPGTGVEGLLLTPDDVLGVGVAIEGLLELLPREGVELLDTDDGGVLDAFGLTVFRESSKDLTRAENDARDILGLVDGLAVLVLREDPAEVRIANKLLNRRAAERVTQERLGEEEDQSYKQSVQVHTSKSVTRALTFPELAVDLSAEDMEQVRRRSWVSNLDIAVLMLAVQLVGRWEDTGILIAKLEVTLQSAGGVLRTLAIVTVRQRHHETRALEPFRLARGDELVNDTLSVVGEVTELGLPHHESVGRGKRVAVLEAKTETKN